MIAGRPFSSRASGERLHLALSCRAGLALFAPVTILAHLCGRSSIRRLLGALLVLFLIVPAPVSCLGPAVSLLTAPSTTSTGPRRDLSLAERPKATEPPPATCACQVETACGTQVWDPCVASGSEFNFHQMATSAVQYWRYMHAYHNDCLSYEPEKQCFSFSLVKCPTPPIMLHATGDYWCWSQINVKCRPRPLSFLNCLYAALSFLSPYDESFPGRLCTLISIDKLVEMCRGYYAEVHPYMVSTPYYTVKTYKIDRPIAVGKITLHTKATYTCTNEANPLGCDSSGNVSCGHIFPSTTSDTAYDVIPPEELRKSHYRHALKIACSWTNNFLFDLIEWVGFLDPNHRLQTPVVWWSAEVQRHSAEPYTVAIHDVSCNSDLPIASFQILTGPSGERYSAGDAAVGDLRSFGATAYFERGKIIMGETHAVMKGLDLQIYSVQFDTHNLIPVGAVLPYHNFAQCYEYRIAPLKEPWCQRLSLQYLGLRHRDRGLYQAFPTPEACHLEKPGSKRYTVLRRGSQLLLVPRSLFLLNGSTVVVPPAPGLPSPLQIENDKLTIQYNLFTFIAAATVEVARLLSDPMSLFEAAALPCVLVFILYASIRKLAWRPAVAAGAGLYFFYLQPE